MSDNVDLGIILVFGATDVDSEGKGGEEEEEEEEEEEDEEEKEEEAVRDNDKEDVIGEDSTLA
jgi:GTPase SAR1 family protein